MKACAPQLVLSKGKKLLKMALVSARNYPACKLNCIVMDMRKTKRETEGYCLTYYENVTPQIIRQL